MKKVISCGILIFYENIHVLLGHVTNNFATKSWNIPKGHLEDNESYVECAIRETWEESNLSFNEKDLIDLGMFTYIPNKDLYLFGAELKNDCLLKTITCNSYVKNDKGADFPEFDKLSFWKISDLGLITTKNVYNTLTCAINKYKEIKNGSLS